MPHTITRIITSSEVGSGERYKTRSTNSIMIKTAHQGSITVTPSRREICKKETSELC